MTKHYKDDKTKMTKHYKDDEKDDETLQHYKDDKTLQR